MDDDDDEMEVDPPSKPTPTKAGTKRSSNSSASTPKKRPVTGNGSKAKPECKYGVKCYQKGKEHREKFSHPRVCHGHRCSKYLVACIIIFYIIITNK